MSEQATTYRPGRDLPGMRGGRRLQLALGVVWMLLAAGQLWIGNGWLAATHFAIGGLYVVVWGWMLQRKHITVDSEGIRWSTEFRSGGLRWDGVTTLLVTWRPSRYRWTLGIAAETRDGEHTELPRGLFSELTQPPLGEQRDMVLDAVERHAEQAGVTVHRRPG